MVTIAPSPHPLSQDDLALLTAYIRFRFNLIALADHSKWPILTLKEWAVQPHIQFHIKQYLELEHLQHQVETTDARTRGIRELFNLLAISRDPIERRRAAQTLIRVGSNPEQPTSKPQDPAAVTPNDDPSNHTTNAASPTRAANDPHDPHDFHEPHDPQETDQTHSTQELPTDSNGVSHATHDATLDDNDDTDEDLDEDLVHLRTQLAQATSPTTHSAAPLATDSS